LRGFFYEVREFFAVLLGKSKPHYIGFLRKPSGADDKPSKRATFKLGFRK